MTIPCALPLYTPRAQLHIEGAALSDTSAGPLADFACASPSFRALGINGVDMGDAAASVFGDRLARGHRLQHVGVTLARMTDAGVAHLARGLAASTTTSVGGARFCPLETVYVFNSGYRGAEAVTQAGIDAMRAALPTAVIVNDWMCTPSAPEELL